MLSIGFILFTAWNIFLATVPVVMALALVRADRFPTGRRRTLTLVFMGLAWMAFLPNSCYLMTEWRHFLFNPHFRAARDAANPNDLSVLRVARHAGFFVAYSGYGMLCFVLAIRPVHRLIRARGLRTIPVAVPFFLAVSLGVYLGLILRLNSWDLLIRPWHVASSAASAIMSPALVAIVVAYAATLALAFLLGDIWMDGFALRLTRASDRPPASDTPASR